VLLDAEQKQNHDHQNFELSEWLWLVRDVLSDAKNVLDENLRKKVIKAHSSSYKIIVKINLKVKCFCSSWTMCGMKIVLNGLS
jgi:hypothetical protein